MKKILLDDTDEQSIAHYSPAIIHNKIIYVSGQLPIYKGEKKPRSENINDQTIVVLEKLKQILEKAGSDLTKVLRTTIYISDISFWDKVNSTYAKFFGEHRPARTIVPVSSLHFGCLIELDAIAYMD